MSGIKITQLKPPCKDCPNRQMACHSTCDLYKDYERAKQQYYEDKKSEGTEIEKYYVNRWRKKQ